MNAKIHFSVDPVVRSNLDFHLENMQKDWFENDPFKTRFFDAISILFPDGERYFIESVRRFRSEIKDPKLQQAVADFIRQEAQHGIAHSKMNLVLESKGVPALYIAKQGKDIFDWMTEKLSPRLNLTLTAAFEHMTALMAESFFAEKQTFADADPYVRALLAWHSIEEMEHRDVAYDVMSKVGDVPEWMRKIALPMAIVHMMGFSLFRTHYLLRHEGYSRTECMKMFVQGVPKLFGTQGTLGKNRKQLFAWFKKGFHPSQHTVIAQYDVWIKVLEETGDPIQAGEAFWQAGR